MKKLYYSKKNLKNKSKSTLKKIEMHSYDGAKKIAASGAKDLRSTKKTKSRSRR